MQIIFLLLTIITINLYAIVPQPTTINYNSSLFTLTKTTQIYSDNTLSKDAIEYFKNHIERNSNFILSKRLDVRDNAILYLRDKSLKGEAYRIDIDEKNIFLRAGTKEGFFYATISVMHLTSLKIWQKIELKHKKKIWKFKGVSISDAPRFKWRGFMLDSSRNFFTKEYIELVIDRMAMYKLNLFHWHLSDDEAWRIEIKRYPRLISIGSNRGDGTKLPFHMFPTMRGEKRGVQSGYYTQEDIKEIVAYAKKRGVQILPEIDIPAHSKAAVISYPELLQIANDESHYKSVQGVKNNTIDAGLNSSYLFYENVFKEIVQLFPFEYIHIGGDEIPKGAWRKSKAVSKLMQRNNYTTLKEVKKHFVRKIERILYKYDKKMIGWEEILFDISRDESMIISWKGSKSALRAIKQKRRLILSPATVLYLDAKQSSKHGEIGAGWAGINSVKEIYTYKALDNRVSKKDYKYIYGVEACLWSERLFNESIADYMTWPRLFAFSELAWSSKKRGWKQFRKLLLYEQKKL